MLVAFLSEPHLPQILQKMPHLPHEGFSIHSCLINPTLYSFSIESVALPPCPVPSPMPGPTRTSANTHPELRPLKEGPPVGDTLRTLGAQSLLLGTQSKSSCCFLSQEASEKSPRTSASILACASGIFWNISYTGQEMGENQAGGESSRNQGLQRRRPKHSQSTLGRTPDRSLPDNPQRPWLTAPLHVRRSAPRPMAGF